jgi:hypothetical protein
MKRILAVLGCAGLLATVVGVPAIAGHHLPSATLTSPEDGATYTSGDTITLSLDAVDGDHDFDPGVTDVEWWLYAEADHGAPTDFRQQRIDQVGADQNPEAKVLLALTRDAPEQGTVEDGTWTASWTVPSEPFIDVEVDGDHTDPVPDGQTRRYDLPSGEYRIQGHVLNEAWHDDPGVPGFTDHHRVTLDIEGSGAGNPADSVDIGGLTEPTSVTVTDEGRVYIAEKGGAIKLAPSLSASSASTVASVDTYDNGDHGLTSIANGGGTLYVTYTQPPEGYCDPSDYGDAEDSRGCVVGGQLSSFEIGADGSLGPEQPLLGGTDVWCAQFTTHGIDDVVVGPDGELYVSAGDGAGFTSIDYGQFDDDPCGGDGSWRTQPESDLLNGKVARIDPADGTVEAIVATGLRNPWTMALDGDQLYIGDVGWYTAEQVYSVDLTSSAVPNFGWPCSEGTWEPSGIPDEFLDRCAAISPPEPVFAYTHAEHGASGVSAIEVHDGRLYFGDYHRNIINSVSLSGTDEREEMTGPLPVGMASTELGLLYVHIGEFDRDTYSFVPDSGHVRTVSGTASTPPPSVQPMVTVTVDDTPWEPGEELTYGVDFRDFERAGDLRVRWTITLDDGTVLVDGDVPSSELVLAPNGEDGSHTSTMTAPDATYPAELTFRATVSTNRDEQTDEVTRQMAEPPSNGAPPPSNGAPPPSNGAPPEDGPEPDTPDDPDQIPEHDDVAFTDIVDNLHRDQILDLVDRGIIQGYDDGTFRPAALVTRGQMASLLDRALDFPAVTCDEFEERLAEQGTGSNDPDRCGFTDVTADSVHAPAILALASAGVIEGFNDGRFRAAAPITRGQMASLLQRALDLPPDGEGFPDMGTAHADAIRAIQAAGITQGYADGTFRPGDPTRRDHTAAFLHRALG